MGLLRCFARADRSLTLLLCIMAAGCCPASNALGATVTGAADPEAPLEIDPGSLAEATSTADINFYTGDDVFSIVDMPSTRTTNRVTLGPIGRESNCERSSVFLKIREIGGEVIAQSTSAVSLPASPEDMVFDVPPTTLKKGHAYAFNLWHGGTTCVSGVRLTWPHEGLIDGGEVRCTETPFHGASYYRMWHVEGLSDEPICPYGREPSNFEPLMPTGWLSVRQFYPSWLVDYDHPFGLVPPHCSAELGNDPVYWKQDPVNENYSYYACAYTQFTAPGTKVADGWYYASQWNSTFGGTPRDMHLKLEPIDYTRLIAEDTPIYAFDQDENFYPQNASAFTDSWEAAEGRGYILSTDYDNILFNGQEEELAAAGSPETGTFPPTLSLSTLAAHYDFDGSLSRAEDYIDARGSEVETYEEDSDRMRELGDDEIVYARAVYDPSDFRLWIQYWVFYYYNSFETFGLGLHEGDWEMIQVGLDGSLQPSAVTYAAHDGGHSCAWEDAETVAGAPVVYVAAKSHASYLHAGSTGLYPLVATDQHRGDGPISGMQAEDITASTGWPTWKGRWGSSRSGSFQSPVNVSQQGDKWSAPSTFYTDHLEAEEC